MFHSPTLRLAGSMSCFAVALVGCGGNDPRFAPLGEDEPQVPSAEAGHALGGGSATPNGRVGEGALEVTAATRVTSYLTQLRGVITDASGNVVAGAEAEAEASADAAQPKVAPDLRLIIPEGEGYTLTLTASTADAEPTVCRAVVGPLGVLADATATVRVLSWDCGGATGYVPNAVASECFWLAEWLFVGRTRARVGEDIEVSAAGHDAQGNPARFDWSAPAPSLGRFEDPRAARTSFRCREAGAAQPLTVAISDSECQAELSQSVACQ